MGDEEEVPDHQEELKPSSSDDAVIEKELSCSPEDDKDIKPSWFTPKRFYFFF